jgi:hypothetical protein
MSSRIASRVSGIGFFAILTATMSATFVKQD